MARYKSLAMAARLGLLAASLAAPVLAADAPGNPTGEKVGQHFQFLASNLARPNETPASQSRVKPLPLPAQPGLSLPAGFTGNLFASGLENARWLAIADNGDVFLAEPMVGPNNAGKITLLRDADGDGKAELKTTFVDGLTRPHGMVFHDGNLYVGAADGVWKIPYKPGDTKATSKTRITEDGAFGNPMGSHWTRNLAVDSKGKIYVAIGSAENVGEDPPMRAAVSTVEGNKLVQFGTGLRNPVGIAFYPGTDDLYVVVNERDGLGEELVPDYLTRVQKGDFFGWPYAYLGQHPDPEFGPKRPDMVAKAKVPDVLFRSHSAPLGLLFYTGTQFPAAYRGGAFVALHGSWNAAEPRGYKVVYVPFKNGRPSGGYDNFALGFWQSSKAPANVIGRPVGLAQTKDGSLLIADDVGNAIWRVTYKGN